MKEYRIKVIELHSDFVWVTASSEEEAKEEAVKHSQCEYESLYDCEVWTEREINQEDLI